VKFLKVAGFLSMVLWSKRNWDFSGTSCMPTPPQPTRKTYCFRKIISFNKGTDFRKKFTCDPLHCNVPNILFKGFVAAEKF